MPRFQQNLLKKERTSRLRAVALLIGVCTILLFNASILYRNMEELRKHQDWVAHTNTVMSKLEMLLSQIKDVVNGHRGYIITHESMFLDRIRDSRLAAADYLSELRELTRDNLTQNERLQRLDEEIKSYLQLLDGSLALLAHNNGDADLVTTVTNGKRILDNVRAMISTVEQEETALLAKRSAAAEEARRTVNNFFIFSSCLSLLLTLTAFWFIRRELLSQARVAWEQEEISWLKNGQTEVSGAVTGDQSLNSLSEKVLAYLTSYIEAPLATLYTVNNRMTLDFVSGFATQEQAAFQSTVQAGEGLMGEVLRQDRTMHITSVPEGYHRVSSSLGAAQLKELMIVPLHFEGEIIGVMEFGKLDKFGPLEKRLLEEVAPSIGVGINAVQNRTRLQNFLEETQAQSEELQAQQEELRANNEELEEKGKVLQTLSERLQVQQVELRSKNDEMQQQALALEDQQKMLTIRNLELQTANQSIQDKARELELASQYKSEFLANMSHELRTPLNSLLILATLLYENKAGNLTEQQINFARTIHRSGEDLLNLINDILDLTKVEAGRMVINAETVDIRDMVGDFENMFRPMVEKKGLTFKIQIESDLPASLQSDRQRLEQIIKNFLSNACKFTEKGTVELRVKKHGREGYIAFAIKDSGIGIPKDKQEIIFEAFQQADSSTNRKYGGTGLGLTISREMARLLGGSIELDSEPGKGSIFSLVVPEVFKNTEIEALPEVVDMPLDQRPAPAAVAAPTTAAAPVPETATVPMPQALVDMMQGRDVERHVLIVEDDRIFGDTLQAVAHDSGFHVSRARDGATALHMMAEHPPSGIILDIKLPDMSGLNILSMIKENPRTSHIPVHVVSGFDYIQSALKLGAVGYLLKPVDTQMLRAAFQRMESTIEKQLKHVLVIEDNQTLRDSMSAMIRDQSISVAAVGTAEDALELVKRVDYDCIVLDLKLPQVSGFEFLDQLGQLNLKRMPPIIVYTGKDLSDAEVLRLRRYSDHIILKGIHSPDRLLDEVSLFLHRVETDLPKNENKADGLVADQDAVFKERRILLVDDDMRNVFALNHALEQKGLRVTVAKNGQEALEQLDQNPGMDMVLMDIMMPVMDGYQAITEIRKDARFQRLPIIALTAKAMKGDQEKCLAVGASDYLPKPINLDRLYALMKVWLTLGSKVA